jgi:hypothetical protein
MTINRIGWCAAVAIGAAAVTAASAQTPKPPPVMKVSIDVKPGDSPTTLERNRGGYVPVAILSTADFDATTVDVESVRVGPSGEEAEAWKATTSDANDDRRPDLVVLVKVADLQLRCTDTVVKLTAKTQDGQAIEGSEAIKVTGCVTP